MTQRTGFSVLDLLDLPPAERELFLQITRSGPISPSALAASTGLTSSEVEAGLAQLIEKKRARRLADGRVDAVLGRIGAHTTLPPELWPALLAPQRLYSEQEIAVLSTAVPMLQFARARLLEFADHGPNHALRVKSYATQLSYVVGLTESERHLLRAGALFHDIGNVIGRERHHVISQETVERLAAEHALPFSAESARVVGLLCRWHRHEYDPARLDVVEGETVRTGLMASILRVSDAMDIDSRRSDYDERSKGVLAFFFPRELEYHTSLEEVLGVRVHCAPKVELQVITRGPATDNMQIQMLRRDLESTPLGWQVRQLPVQAEMPHPTPAPDANRAVVVIPVDAPSLIMAALSRSHLLNAGHPVELLCYPDTVGGAEWLWQEALKAIPLEDIGRIVVIGDRPAVGLNLRKRAVLERWQGAGVRVSILNRHEANWSQVPDLLEHGVDVTLGGDWAYFWGTSPTSAGMWWSRIAALCARDPTMASVRISELEQAVMRGVLFAVYDRQVASAANDTADWRGLAEPLLDRIAADDRGYFANLEGAFLENYGSFNIKPELHGRVLVFRERPGRVPQTFYWMLEAAIEQRGPAIGCPGEFASPYALAFWREGESCQLLGISHWREQRATPIRLLYPDIGARPEGTESTVLAQLAPQEADLVIDRLISACNR